SEQGRHAEAQQMLQMLANILQNLDVQLAESQGGEGEQSDGNGQMQQSMDQLSEAMGEQRALRDQTEQAQQQQQQGQQSQGGSGGDQQGGMGGDELAQRQAEIRQGLAEAQRMSEQAGGAPSEDLNAAGEAMRRAEE